jgi:hypothetical protein
MSSAETPMSYNETFAFEHAEQYLGCCSCRESHHETSFCSKCGQCFHCLIGVKGRVNHTEYGTFVSCPCGSKVLWD